MTIPEQLAFLLYTKTPKYTNTTTKQQHAITKGVAHARTKNNALVQKVWYVIFLCT